MVKYYYKLENISKEETAVSKAIRVGNRTITFNFQWAIASEEQCNMVMKHLVKRADTDPLSVQGNMDRTYNWLGYYVSLADKDLNEWLDTNPSIPFSIKSLPRNRQIQILQYRIQEALSIAAIVDQYVEVMRWQVSVVSADTDPTSCFVELGGWNRNQDNHYAFRFLSGRQYIGREDLNELYIEFEVYDE